MRSRVSPLRQSKSMWRRWWFQTATRRSGDAVTMHEDEMLRRLKIASRVRSTDLYSGVELHMHCRAHGDIGHLLTSAGRSHHQRVVDTKERCTLEREGEREREGGEEMLRWVSYIDLLITASSVLVHLVPPRIHRAACFPNRITSITIFVNDSDRWNLSTVLDMQGTLELQPFDIVITAVRGQFLQRVRWIICHFEDWHACNASRSHYQVHFRRSSISRYVDTSPLICTAGTSQDRNWKRWADIISLKSAARAPLFSTLDCCCCCCVCTFLQKLPLRIAHLLWDWWDVHLLLMKVC